MVDEIVYPFRTPALRVVQPLGEFYVTKLSAKLLLEVSYSDPLRVIEETESSYLLLGAQREESLKRRKEIGRYIETVEAAFPNSIILGANYRKNGMLEEDDGYRWQVEATDREDFFYLLIPSQEKLVSIIDGQHRLFGFMEANSNRSSMELLCAVYLDLPTPYQAYLFATINFNQKSVDRSLAYELFGFNLEAEPPESWSPEKAAVFLTRKLNMDETSPFHQHIIIAAQSDEVLLRSKSDEVDWAVSTATVVDGILGLISSNPQRDRDSMHQKPIGKGRMRSMLEKDKAPLRNLYLRTNDLAIYTAVKNFFLAVEEILWTPASEQSYIKKTVGIQALFDILRLLLVDFERTRDISVEFFRNHLSKARRIDFSDNFFQASGKGKSRIMNLIAFKIGIKNEDQLPPLDLGEYQRLAR